MTARRFILISAIQAFAIASASAAAPSFRNQVQPILTRYGCAMGACHGAAAGQGGFKLSLRGFDDDGDFLSVTRHANGRRVNLDDPARSLLLLKATAMVPHKGDKRVEAGSPEYQLLADWIAHGAPGPGADDARITALEVDPAHLVGKAGSSQQIRVTAKFSDGRSEDVTRWAKYNGTNAAVATVDENGLVKVAGAGEGTVSAWYLSRLAVVTVSIPQEQPINEAAFASIKPRNFVDELALEKLRELNIPPSPKCDDHDFIRRAFLDTTGVLPTAAEVSAFAADGAPDKRDKLIETLMRRPEFVDYWTYRWSDLFLVNSNRLPIPAMWSYYNWIRKHVAANTPWDALVRELLTATGSTFENGAGNFFLLHDEPTKLAENVSVAFLGMSIACAKCHNHPMEKWTYDEYYAFANLFSRVRAKNGPVKDERVIFSATEGELVQPLTGKPQAPRPLDVLTPVSMTSTEDRRVPMAKWLTSADNSHFKRAVVNRVWANFFGVGLVESVDDLRVTNPASNEKLLTKATDFLVEKKFNLRELMRAVMQSEIYQRSSEAVPGNESDTRFYSRFYPRRLKAEVLMDAISQVTAAPTSFSTDRRNANRAMGESYPMGFRALQLPDSNVSNYFLKSFGRPDRVQTCECERTNEPSMAQALHIANGNTTNEKLAQKNNRIDQLISAKLKTPDLVQQIYLTVLSRPPSPTEKDKLVKMHDSTPESERRLLLEDVFWSLLSSKEFLFNH